MRLNWIAGGVLAALGGWAEAQQEGPDALSRIFKHNNGQRTETQKMGGSNEIRESIYDKINILCGVRVFRLDAKGRILNGVIYDGKKNPVGSTRNFFDAQTGQMLKEELYNQQGKKVRELFYPGSLSDPRYAKRMVAFNYDPQNPSAPRKEAEGKVQPIVPVTKDEEDFDPSLPQGTAAPTAAEAAARPAAAARPLPKRSSWMKQKGSGN